MFRQFFKHHVCQIFSDKRNQLKIAMKIYLFNNKKYQNTQHIPQAEQNIPFHYHQ